MNQSFKVVVYLVGLPAVEFRLGPMDIVDEHNGVLCIKTGGGLRRCFVIANIEGWSVEPAL